MALPDQLTPASRNRLLAALPPDDLARLWPQLEAIELPFRQVLYTPGKPIEPVYFPETGYASMLAYMEDGDAAEVGLAGREGLSGCLYCLVPTTTTSRSWCNPPAPP
ncbi:hypothetical protein GCM10011504_38650 [Siccirubricoccus deserti]|uniref:hypothetical protein n=1 Tax=Siccirubricoccus deserti TaxID=2013562 RepID=UPI0019C35833|nr:hypothetical protein [Siccirubricoccus deserti]GGC56552.1 hypothetical protein GCM10011504_38650 [Siccirubricoccus deserti]